MSSDIAIRVEKLGKRYRIGALQERHDTLRDKIAAFGPQFFSRLKRFSKGEHFLRYQSTDLVWALRDVSFEVKRGEVVGIIGRNGAGKTTLLKILSRITEPTEGWAEIHGRVGSLLEVGTGFHPELTGRENIYLNGAILGMRRVEIDRKFDEIVAFAEIEKFLDTPVKRYSSGMYVRLAFAVAAHLDPEILFVDEVLAVGDLQFQRKCLGKMKDVAMHGRTVLFVSHTMDAVRNLCSRAILLDQGHIAQSGDAHEVISRYMGFSERAAYRKLALESKVITLHEIQIKNSHEALADSLRYDEDFYIEIACQVHQKTRSLSIGIIVYGEAGEAVFTTTSRGSQETKDLDEGRDLLRIEVPGYFLSPGQYSVFVNAHTTFDLFLQTHNAVSFRVLDVGREVLGREGQMQWPGVVCPRLRWRNIRQGERLRTFADAGR